MALVVPWRGLPQGPTIKIGEYIYVLSDRQSLKDDSDTALDDEPFRYLCAWHNGVLVIWYLYSGRRKIELDVDPEDARYKRLQERNQLNRLTPGEFKTINAYMAKRAKQFRSQMSELVTRHLS